MLVNPLTVVMLRREAERHCATGYDGVVLNNAAGARSDGCSPPLATPTASRR
jgi:hypothetical protein